MEYRESDEISKSEVESALSKSEAIASEALIRAASTIPDVDWVEGILLQSMKDSRMEVQRAAIIGLGHLARIHRRLTLSLVVPALQNYTSNSMLAGAAEDALEDITVFLGDSSNN